MCDRRNQLVVDNVDEGSMWSVMIRRVNDKTYSNYKDTETNNSEGEEESIMIMLDVMMDDEIVGLLTVLSDEQSLR